MKIVGIDLSLTSTGIVRAEDGKIVGFLNPQTKGRRGDTLAERSHRLYGIANVVMDATKDADLIVIEAPSYGSTGGSAHDRSGLWWNVVMQAIESDGIPVAQVSPQGRAKYGTGRGNSKKDVVFAAVKHAYSELFPGGVIPNDDVADATLLVSMGSRHVGQVVETWDVNPVNLQAMDGVLWPIV